MSGRTRIRTVSRPDRDAWLALRAQLWPTHTRKSLRKEVDSFLRGGGLWSLGSTSIPCAVWVAEEPKERIVGFVEASLRPFAEGCRTGPVGYVEGWFVARRHRHRGIGRALVRAAERWARARGCTEMASDAAVWNRVSVRSHRALGYAEVHRLVHLRRSLK
jgi:aminoglycoside 6'-N-acetyltransferase I